MKVCSKCGIEKPLEDFYRAKRYKDGRQHYCKACKKDHQQSPEQRANQKTYYDDNREKQIADAKQWANDNRVRSNAIKRRWEKRNPEKVLKASKSWKKRNPEKVYHYSVNRRVREQNVLSTLTPEEWQSRLEEFNFHCAYCLKPFGTATPEIDHMLPISRGGTHTLDNCVPACRSCNAQKSDKTPAEFLAYVTAREEFTAVAI